MRANFFILGYLSSKVRNELLRGTPSRKGDHGRFPIYKSKRGQKAYEANRRRSRRPCKIERDDCDPLHPMNERACPQRSLVYRYVRRICTAKRAVSAGKHPLYFSDEHSSEIFKTMTADNAPEFETLSQSEKLGTKIYFTHPYIS